MEVCIPAAWPSRRGPERHVSLTRATLTRTQSVTLKLMLPLKPSISLMLNAQASR